jgi:hypothetical protein
MLHIAAGTLGLLSGFGALAFRKGETLHRISGTVFFLSMLVMAGVGAYMAAILPQRGTVFIGILTFYLVATAWVTVRRKENTTGPLFDYAALAVAVACAVMLTIYGVMASMSPKGLVDSLPAAAHYPFAAIALLAVVLDFKVMRAGGIAGPPRIARHLWRMCTALVIAAFSFFLGQQKVMPVWMQGSPALFAPPLIALALMIFWLIRVRFTKWYERTGAPVVAEHDARAASISAKP